MEDRDPQEGDMYTLHEIYISPDHQVVEREIRLEFRAYNRGFFLLNTMSCSRDQAANFIFRDEEGQYKWIYPKEFPVWVNPDPKNEPGDIHYKVILYTP